MCVIEKVKVKPKPGLLENRTHSLRWLPNINSRSFKPQRKKILNLWTSLEGDLLQCMIEKAFNFEFFFPHDIYLRSLFSCVQLTEENRFIFRTTHASPVDPNLTFLCFTSSSPFQSHWNLSSSLCLTCYKKGKEKNRNLTCWDRQKNLRKMIWRKIL